MPFCENCGKELKPTSKFCGHCGTPINVGTQPVPPRAPEPVVAAAQPAPQAIAPPVASAPTAAPVSSEPVVGVIVLRKPKSLGRYDSFSGVITNQRFIFAQMTGDMLKDAVKQAREQAKSEGKGFFGQWGEQLKASASFAGRYYNMEPSAVLAETAGNFAVDNNTVNEIKLKLKDHGDQSNQRDFEIEVKASSGKYKFRMDENNDYVKMLKQIYGDRVKTPFGYFSAGGLKFKLG
ncbi:MAG: zinc ribbon domain-containing protein [Candidatus Bathyarchaeia archaeon]|jgi:hypothetical protein